MRFSRENLPVALEVDAQLELAIANVAWAADQARAQGASIMIEAVDSYENGPYLLDTTVKAVGLLGAFELGYA